MKNIENVTFDEIEIGASARLSRTLTIKDIELFAIVSGDVNPTHVDEEFAQSELFHKVVAHGMWGGSLISNLLGTELPGPGTIYLNQSLQFLAPVALGDTVTAVVKVIEKKPQQQHVVLECSLTNQFDVLVISGRAEVVAPTKKISRERVVLPEAEFRIKGRRYQQLITRTQDMEPIVTAVVCPVDTISLIGAIEAAKLGLIIPILIGPEDKIRLAASKADIDLSDYQIIATENSEEAALLAVAMARAGNAEALMKGSLHTDELMRAVVDPKLGLRGERRMSHVFAIDAPNYPRALFITDAALNIYPNLEAKRDIVQNAIELAHALGNPEPRVAILSAVETVNPNIASTLDAAALCKMADRGQITGGILDGPLAFDNAVSAEAAKTKGIVSPVAGLADIFLVPDIEAGNMLAKQLEYLADAEMAGIVLGARVPIILTSRADKTIARLGSCAIALLLVRNAAAKKALKV